MNTRYHGNYGHGLRPGTTADMGCPNCKREDAAKIDTAKLAGILADLDAGNGPYRDIRAYGYDELAAAIAKRYDTPADIRNT